ncbi:MAG: OprO/OprP family phosphate-selective porin [Panacagrimonas sp.]
MRLPKPVPVVLIAAAAALSMPVAKAADDLLETLAQKGVITLEEYEKLKAQRKTAPTVSTDEGFRIGSGDGAWTVQPGALQQLDIAGYDADKVDLSDGTEMRRSRLSLGGTFFKDWQYRVEYEFATGASALTDAYVAYTALKPVTVTLGQFKPPFGMEAVTQDKSATFMERALPFYLVSPLIVRAPGAMLGTSWAKGSVAAGVFGEPIGNAQSGDEGYGAAARASFAPFLEGSHLVHLGLGAQWRNPTADNFTDATTGEKFETVSFRAKPESNILSQRLVDTGTIRKVKDFSFAGVELAGQWDAVSLQAEYQQVHVSRDDLGGLDFDTGYAQLAWTLTGEPRPYRVDRGVFEGIKPKNNFGKDGWGAFEVAARFSTLDLSDDTVKGGRERNATAALSWYLNPFLRLSANYVKVTEVKGGVFDGEEPSIWQMRLQLAI